MIVTLSGASGTGKTTIAKALYERLPNSKPLVSYTTREPRPTDLPGDYAFVSDQEFDAMETHGDFLWTARVGDTRYGTTKDSLRHALDDASNIHVMILVPERVPNVHEFAGSFGKNDQIKSFLIETPSHDILKRRMEERGEDAAVIEKRLIETGNYESRARALNTPIVYIEDRDDLEAKIQDVLHHIQ